MCGVHRMDVLLRTVHHGFVLGVLGCTWPLSYAGRACASAHGTGNIVIETKVPWRNAETLEHPSCVHLTVLIRDEGVLGLLGLAVAYGVVYAARRDARRNRPT